MINSDFFLTLHPFFKRFSVYCIKAPRFFNSLNKHHQKLLK
ncbi:hypothetical protein COO91_10226 (plasmid) [Nostoc flagelliforme CCNUN1]|uniref:Uncharacterized protein n=1 Tax=Nostoc flagelliforme CCNUN1 TaxID=2038116 RepID=A0A2K8T8L3_9NOSO|nr:hypothetical protein COO91_10226 [Nostoc flagelliforme CCNUN1]